MNTLVVAAGVLLAVAAIPFLGYAALYALMRPRASPAEKRQVEPSVSVILPTYNEAAIIERKLEDLAGQVYPMEQVEVVVVDASDDETAELAKGFAEDLEHPTLALVDEESRGGVARAVNRGVEVATGDVVFRTDCDSLLADDALRQATANLADPRIGVVTGRQSSVIGESQVEQDYRDLLARMQSLESHVDSTFICHGPAMAFRRDDFDPVDPRSLADDTEIGVNVRRSGKRVIMDPELRFMESGTSSFAGRRLRKDRRALGLMRLLVQRREMLGRYGSFGRVILPFYWWSLVVAPWLIFAGVGTGLAGTIRAFGMAGLVVPLLGVVLVWLGQRDSLGPLQPLHAVFDAQVSLLVAAVRLVAGGADGTWTVDETSREAFE